MQVKSWRNLALSEEKKQQQQNPVSLPLRTEGSDSCACALGSMNKSAGSNIIHDSNTLQQPKCATVK